MTGNKGGQLCEGPPPASTKSDEESVPAGRGAENAVDPGNVFHSVVEHDKRHGGLTHGIVFLQIVFHGLSRKTSMRVGFLHTIKVLV